MGLVVRRATEDSGYESSSRISRAVKPISKPQSILRRSRPIKIAVEEPPSGKEGDGPPLSVQQR